MTRLKKILKAHSNNFGNIVEHMPWKKVKNENPIDTKTMTNAFSSES
jgi:hypothetical protein